VSIALSPFGAHMRAIRERRGEYINSTRSRRENFDAFRPDT
jgi:hypothetical protein